MRAQYRIGQFNPSAEDLGIDETVMKFQNPCSGNFVSFRNVSIKGWHFVAGEYERKGIKNVLSWFASTRLLLALPGPPQDAVFVRIRYMFKHTFNDDVERALLGVCVVPQALVFLPSGSAGRVILKLDVRTFDGPVFVVSTEAVLCPISLLHVTHLSQHGFLVIRRGIKY